MLRLVYCCMGVSHGSLGAELDLERHRPGSRHLIRACVHSVEGPGPIRQSRVHGLLSTPLTEINVPSEGEPQDPDNGRDHIAQEPD